MRVLMASRGVAGVREGSGGAERVAYLVARELAVDGHDVWLIEDVADDFEPVDGLTIVPIDSKALRLLQRSPGRFLRWLVQHFVGNVAVARIARRLVREHDFDVVHTHGNLATILIARGSRLPVVYTEHDASPWSCRYRRWWERAIRKTVYRAISVPAYRAATAVVTVFEAMQGEICERWSISMRKLRSVTNGTDLDVFHPARSGPSLVRTQFGLDRYCVFVGRLTPRKAPDLLLRALEEAPEVKCAFIGDGPMRGKLEQLAADLGVADRVAFTGNLSPAELASVYAEADFLVLPSVSEGTPLAILEAMASGIPVLTTRLAGAAHLVRDWENGFVVKPGSVGQLAMGLRFLHGDNALRERMGVAGRARAQSQFPWPAVARRYAAVYEQVAAVGAPATLVPQPEEMPALATLHA